MTVRELVKTISYSSVVTLIKEKSSGEPELMGLYFPGDKMSIDSLLCAYGDTPVERATQHKHYVSIFIAE